jgi:hypothetical protein
MKLPMLSHAWILACARTFHAGDALHVISVSRDGVLAAAAPLVACTHGGVERLELMGPRRCMNRRAWCGRGVLLSKPVAGTLAVSIESSWSDYLARLSSQLPPARRRRCSNTRWCW